LSGGYRNPGTCCSEQARKLTEPKLSGTATAVKGGAVYVYGNTASGSHIQGGFEAESPATGFLLSGATLMGPADASGNTEISFNIA